MHPDWVYGLVSNRDRDAEAVWVIEKVLNGAPFMEIPEGVLIGIGRGP